MRKGRGAGPKSRGQGTEETPPKETEKEHPVRKERISEGGIQAGK